MPFESTVRVKTEFQELTRLHAEFMKTQITTSKAGIILGLVAASFGFFLSAFGIIRLIDGLAFQLTADGSGRAQYLSGGIQILLAALLFGLAFVSLRKTQKATQQMFQELREDWRWLRKML